MRRELVLLLLLISISASVCLGQTDSPPASGSEPAPQAAAEKADKKVITSYSLPPEEYEKAVAYSNIFRSK